jgi:predicted ArsR family transcriptional regulator
MTSTIASAQLSPSLPAGTTAADEGLQAAARTNIARTERLRGLVLEILAAAPDGLTADEIAARLAASVLAVRPRVSELFHAGMIEKSGERRLNQSGLAAHVWKKRPAGAA